MPCSGSAGSCGLWERILESMKGRATVLSRVRKQPAVPTLFCACGGSADVQVFGDGEEHLGQVREFDAGRDHNHDHRGPILEN